MLEVIRPTPLCATVVPDIYFFVLFVSFSQRQILIDTKWIPARAISYRSKIQQVTELLVGSHCSHSVLLITALSVSASDYRQRLGKHQLLGITKAPDQHISKIKPHCVFHYLSLTNWYYGDYDSFNRI